MKYANDVVLEALRLALYRQIPWHKRPAIFTVLRALGLIDTVDRKPPANIQYCASLPVAVLTDKGRQEMARLEASRGASGWSEGGYVVGSS